MTTANSATPLISVVLPTYNRAHLLGHAIRSVLAQTWHNFELIVIDDNSPDATFDVVHAFVDPRIRYSRNERNLKLPGGLNRGFALSRGEFLTWTSDDNFYAPDAFARMAAVLATRECDFVYTDYYHFSDLDGAGAPIDVRHVKLPDQLRLDQANAVGACFMYTRRVYEAVGDYDPELFLVEDYDYWIRVQKRFRIRHIAEPLYYFRRHDDALFCSRYAEVKAADVLVRFKNGLLDERSAVDACAEVIARDPAELSNAILRSVYRGMKRTSFRLTQAYLRYVPLYIRWRISGRAAHILRQLSSHSISFREAKDHLRELMQSVAALQYK